MKVEYLNPFVAATINTCQTMLNLKVEKGALTIKKSATTESEVTSVIGLSGKLRGSIVMGYSKPVAGAMVQRFLGSVELPSDAEICDGIGELCNIVAGSAKAEMNKLKMELSISVPNVILGRGMHVMSNPSYPTLVVPFLSEI